MPETININTTGEDLVLTGHYEGLYPSEIPLYKMITSEWKVPDTIKFNTKLSMRFMLALIDQDPYHVVHITTITKKFFVQLWLYAASVDTNLTLLSDLYLTDRESFDDTEKSKDTLGDLWHLALNCLFIINPMYLSQAHHEKVLQEVNRLVTLDDYDDDQLRKLSISQMKAIIHQDDLKSIKRFEYITATK